MPQQICHSFPVLAFQTLIKSCCIKSRNDPSPKNEVEHETDFSSTHAEWNRHLSSGPLIVGVASYFPQKAPLFFLKISKCVDVNFVQKCQTCQICVLNKTLDCTFCPRVYQKRSLVLSSLEAIFFVEFILL